MVAKGSCRYVPVPGHPDQHYAYFPKERNFITCVSCGKKAEFSNETNGMSHKCSARHIATREAYVGEVVRTPRWSDRLADGFKMIRDCERDGYEEFFSHEWDA